MALEDEIKEAEKEEMHSQEKYGMMAMDAERMGMSDMARMMREMASDEGRHAAMMRRMHGGMVGGKKTYQQIAEEQHYGMPYGYMPKGDRPFPKTYGDWVNLAEDIKERYPDDPVTRAAVNFQLQRIAEREDEDEAKRWLMQEAGRLGIK